MGDPGVGCGGPSVGQHLGVPPVVGHPRPEVRAGWGGKDAPRGEHMWTGGEEGLTPCKTADKNSLGK